MSELSRPVALDRIGAGGLDVEVEARPEELGPITARLRLPAVARLRCRFRLRRHEDGIVLAAGTLEARVTQTCVVSLDEFEQTVSDVFELRFVPAGSETDSDDPDAPDELPYEGGSIDLGEAAVEQLALALDPYPRRPDLPVEDEAADAAPAGPFAALAGLRRLQ